MKCSAERLIEALIGAQILEMQRNQRAEQESRKPLVVTVSRGFGALGKELAQALANRLGVRCCDRYILQEVARQAHIDEALIEALDEHVSRRDSHWWQSLLSRELFTQESYYHYLVKVVISIAQNGGVILGRGGHLILGQEHAFRIRVVGSVSHCAERIALREGVLHEAAEARIRDVDSERAEYIRELYQADINDASAYDLVINSDRFNVDEMVQLVCKAMQMSGYQLPESVQISRAGS